MFENKSFKHTDPDSFHDRELTLHDCVSNKIIYENNTLRFILPEGFWVTHHHRDNPTPKVVRTDASAVDFTTEDLDDILIHVVIRKRRPWGMKTTVETWDMEQLMACVNGGEFVLDFNTQYRAYYEQMWHCSIRSRKKPYYRECYIHLPNTKATYFWNELNPEREW